MQRNRHDSKPHQNGERNAVKSW